MNQHTLYSAGDLVVSSILRDRSSRDRVISDRAKLSVKAADTISRFYKRIGDMRLRQYDLDEMGNLRITFIC